MTIKAAVRWCLHFLRRRRLPPPHLQKQATETPKLNNNPINVVSSETILLQPPTNTPNLNIPIAVIVSMDLSALNDDVLMEILLLLPAKSLIRFKSVSKNWLSLISSDYFCHQHFLRCSKSQPSFILQHSDHGSDPDFFYWKPTLSINGENVTIPYTLSPSASPDNYEILQACNGLLLLDSGRDRYRVYNPTTKLSTDINIPTHNDKYHHITRIALVFDPSKSPYYKIVCIMCCFIKTDDDTLWVEVYDSESHSWKLGLEPFTRPLGFLRCYGAYFEAQYWNNAIYWWCFHSDSYYCFDIAKNEMKALSFPQTSHLGIVLDSYLQELDGRLYYLTLSFLRHQVLATVWEFGGDGNSPPEWLLKHHDDHWYNIDGIGKCVRLMGHYSDGSLQLILYHPRKMKMKAYNLLHRKSEDLVDLTAPPFGYKYDNEPTYPLKAFQFRETLASV